MDITAIIKRIEAARTVGEQNFKFRNLIVTTEEQYPQTLSIQFVQGKCEELDKFAPGQTVKIDINLRGKETTKDGEPVVFNTIQGWRIQKV
jgi:Domain of unknown function (DUF3127)